MLVPITPVPIQPRRVLPGATVGSEVSGIVAGTLRVPSADIKGAN